MTLQLDSPNLHHKMNQDDDTEWLDAGPMAGIGTRRMMQWQEARMREWERQEQARLKREQKERTRQAHEQQRSPDSMEQLRRVQQMSDNPALEHGDQAISIREKSQRPSRPTRAYTESSAAQSAFSEASSSRMIQFADKSAARASPVPSHRSSTHSSHSSGSRSQVLNWDRSRRPTTQLTPPNNGGALPLEADERELASFRDRSGMRESSRSRVSSRQKYVAHRTTVIEALPNATCADCGDQMPFDELMDHTCAKESGRSPLILQMGEQSTSDKDGRERAEFHEQNPSQASFFSQYDEKYIPFSGQASSPPPIATASSMRNVIEAQRKAKRQQSHSEAASTSRPAMMPLAVPESGDTSRQRQHRRHGAGSQSSASTISSKSSSASMFAKSNAETLTPSSSNEHFYHEMPDLSSLKSAIDDVDGKGQAKLKLPMPNANTASARSASKPAKLCSVCLQAGQALIQKDGKLFCVNDYAELFLEKCRKCCQPVHNVGVRSRDGALPGLFHRNCFSCLACDTHFADGTFYIYDSAPYCAKDYHRLNGTLCEACGTGIEGQCRQLAEQSASGKSCSRFHPRCFTCQYDDGHEFCKDALNDYYAVDGKRMCEWHFGKIVQQREARNALADARRQLENGKPASSSKVADAMRAARRTTILHTIEPHKVHT